MTEIRSRRAVLRRALVLVGFAAVMFGCGHLWSLRQVNEARRAAGLAEAERLELERELAACRNALLLRPERPQDSAGSVRSNPGTRLIEGTARD